MTQHILVAANKGGVGKTTTAVNLAYALSINGKTVLIVDLDPRGDVQRCLNPGTPPIDGLYNFLDGGNHKKNIFRYNDSLHVMPGSSKTDRMGILALIEGVTPQDIVRKFLTISQPNSDRSYDYIVYDSPRSNQVIRQAAFSLADTLVIPTQAAVLGLSEVKSMADFFSETSIHWWILPTMYQANLIESKQVLSQIHETFPEHTLLPVPLTTEVRESSAWGKPFLDANTYRNKSGFQAAAAYHYLAKAVLEQGGA